MNRRLIVNADDFNLTRGSARAILEAHLKGIVTSTSVFTNFNFSNGEFDSLKKLKTIGIGLHLNVTLDRPLTQPKLIPSLIQKKGSFKKYRDLLRGPVHCEQLLTEFRLQLLNFRAIFGRDPDHLNTHHHVHADPRFCRVLTRLAQEYQIPVRRSEVLIALRPDVRTSNYFFGSLRREHHWTEESLLNILTNLPQGASEIMCHPAYVDASLRHISSFVNERSSEFKLFSDPKFRKLLKSENIIPQSKF